MKIPYKYFFIAALFSLVTGCKEKTVIQEKNVKVVTLESDHKPIIERELVATRASFESYDCDIDWILFDYNSYQLSKDAKLELEKVASLIIENRSLKARIRAFTDSKGRPEYNRKLSRKRAESAQEYLIREGVPEKNISISAFSEAKPIAVNTEDDTGRKYNRRIELFILDELNNPVCRSHPPEVPESLKLEFQ